MSNMIRRRILMQFGEFLKDLVGHERHVQETTIIFKTTEIYDHEAIVASINREWVELLDREPLMFWHANGLSYCCFASLNEKEEFLKLNYLNRELSYLTKTATVHFSIENFKRKPVPLVLNASYQSIIFSSERVRNIIINQCKAIVLRTDGKSEEGLQEVENDQIDNQISEFKPISGKCCFEVDSFDFKYIFDFLQGYLQCMDRTTGAEMRLKVKIDVRPKVCKNCYSFEPHTCEGSACSECGRLTHNSDSCNPNRTRYCLNCREFGHRAHDALLCRSYLRKIEMLLEKIDIPTEFYTDGSLRFELLKSLLLDK